MECLEILKQLKYVVSSDEDGNELSIYDKDNNPLNHSFDSFARSDIWVDTNGRRIEIDPYGHLFAEVDNNIKLTADSMCTLVNVIIGHTELFSVQLTPSDCNLSDRDITINVNNPIVGKRLAEYRLTAEGFDIHMIGISKRDKRALGKCDSSEVVKTIMSPISDGISFSVPNDDKNNVSEKILRSLECMVDNYLSRGDRIKANRRERNKHSGYQGQ